MATSSVGARPATPFNLRALDEAAQGVLRDVRGNRLIATPSHLLAALRTTWDALAPRGWARFTDAWGHQWGRLAISDLEADARERHGCGLRELPLSRSMEIVARMVQRLGLGSMTIDGSGVRVGAFCVEIRGSAVAEAAGSSDTPRCQLLCGFLRAVLDHLSNRQLAVREAGCRCQGHASCTFLAVMASRAEALDTAIARAHGQLNGVVTALGTPASAAAGARRASQATPAYGTSHPASARSNG